MLRTTIPELRVKPAQRRKIKRKLKKTRSDVSKGALLLKKNMSLIPLLTGMERRGLSRSDTGRHDKGREYLSKWSFFSVQKKGAPDTNGFQKQDISIQGHRGGGRLRESTRSTQLQGEIKT